MLEISKKLKRALCLFIVCIMITPMISFATSDDTTTDDSANADTTGTTDTAGATTALPTEEDNLTEAQIEKLRKEEKERAIAASVIKNGAEEIEDGYVKVTATAKLELYLNKEDLSIIIRDVASGAVFRSKPQDVGVEDPFAISPVSINIHDKNKGGQWQQVKLETRYDVLNDDVEKTVTMKDNGFSVHINYTKYQIEFDYNVSLDDEGLHINAPLRETLKENSDDYKLSVLYIYPFLGATKLDYRDASMFLPDGSGIICDLRDYEEKYGATLYSMQYYGTDIGKLSEVSSTDSTELGGRRVSFTKAGETATMPVFGMIYNDTKMAMLGIVESGAENSYCIYTLNSFANWNIVTGRYHVRDAYLYPTSQSGNQSVLKLMPDIEIENLNITYIFTSGDEADYAGLAVKYREKLQKDGVLEKKDTTPKVRLDILGIDKENFLVFKRNVTMTTVDQAKDMFDDLRDRGINGVLAIYRGWQDGGVYSLPVEEFDVDGDIGSKKDLADLAKDYAAKGVTLALAQDSQTSNPDLSSSTVLEKVNLREYQRSVVSDVFDTFNMVYPNDTKEYSVEFAKQAVEEGISNIAVEGLTKNIFSYAEKDKVYMRRDTASAYVETLQEMKEQGAVLTLNQPNAYLWKYADAYTDLVMGSSSYVYADQEVPFLAIVLKGSIPLYSEYVNFEAEKTKFFLNLIDQGVYPSFIVTGKDPSFLENTNSNYIYSSEYELYKETIQEYYSAVIEVADKTKDAYIVDHEELDSGVNVTTYDNGIKVYTNYQEKPVVVDGLTIDALSYKVGEAK